MDKFLNKKETKDNHTAVKISAIDRVRQYPKGTLHACDGILFCSSCNIVIDHTRKLKIDKHLEAQSHQEKAKSKVVKDQGKQQTLKTAFECKTIAQEEKIKVCQDWIRACSAANILLHKSDNLELRRFFQSRVVNGGAIPKSTQLRDVYLADVYQAEKEDLKKKLENKKIALIADELSDEEGRYVLDVMGVILDFDELSPAEGSCIAYLLDTHFLSETNHKTVSQAIVKTVSEFNISFDDVRVFNSDNVSYMKKAFTDALSCLFPKAVHITCNSHIVSLVANDFKKHCTELDEFMKCFRNLFFKPSGRKSRFIQFMQKRVDPKQVKMPPNPTSKSWSSWFDTAMYHSQYYMLFDEFIDDELSRVSRSLASNSLIRLEEMYEDDNFMKKIHLQLNLIKIKAPALLNYLNYFQQNTPHVTEVHECMADLLFYLNENSCNDDDKFEFCFEGRHYKEDEKQDMISLARLSFDNARKKLAKYQEEGAQPASKFLEQVKVFNPIHLISCDPDLHSYDSIPDMESVPTDEWSMYINYIGPQAVKNRGDEQGIDIPLFWKSKSDKLPHLYKIASCYCSTTIGSYDVERAFSTYNSILDDKRRRLDSSTIKALHFLNWNLRIKSTIEKERTSPDPKKQKYTGLSRSDFSNCKPPPISQKTAQTTPPVVKQASVNQAQKQQQPTVNGPSFYAANARTSTAKSSQTVEQTSHNLQQQEPTTPSCDVNTTATKPTSNSMPQKRKPPIANRNDDYKGKRPKLSGGKLFRSFLNKSISKSPKGSTTQAKADKSPVIQNGLDTNIATKFTTESPCIFPEHKEHLVHCLLDGSVKFQGSNIIDEKDLKSLQGGHTDDKDNYLTNFILDEQLRLLAEKGCQDGLQVVSIEWEKFDRCIGKRPAQKVLKGKPPLLKQDIVLTPCNPEKSEHWFLVVVLPKSKQIIALDSMPASHLKLTIKKALDKMWRLLKELDSSLDVTEWNFSRNVPQEIPTQLNAFDCGVYVLLYARSLVLQSTMVTSCTTQNVRKHMILELHDKALHGFSEPEIEIEKWYAVEYQKSFYFGKALSINSNSFIEFKFLHAVGARIFDWPKRDDVDTCHKSCVFYGPCAIAGEGGPFTFSQFGEIEQVLQYLKKSRKNI